MSNSKQAFISRKVLKLILRLYGFYRVVGLGGSHLIREREREEREWKAENSHVSSLLCTWHCCLIVCGVTCLKMRIYVKALIKESKDQSKGGKKIEGEHVAFL